MKVAQKVALLDVALTKKSTIYCNPNGENVERKMSYNLEGHKKQYILGLGI